MKQVICFLLASFTLHAIANAQVQTTRPTEGLHENVPNWFILEHATIHVSAKEHLDDAAVLIHGERIVEVGTKVTAPEGTTRIDATGKHIYPGLIDAFVPFESKQELPSTQYWNSQIRSFVDVSKVNVLKETSPDKLRAAGFTSAMYSPNSGIVQGKAAVYLLSESLGEQSLLKPNVAMGLSLTTRFRFGERGAEGPTSPMGAYALARQTMLDANWYREAWHAAELNPSLPRPETNTALSDLQDVLNGKLPVLIGTSNEIFSLRAHRFAKEFGLRSILMGNGSEYRRLEEVAALGLPIVLPVDFPEPPSLTSPNDILDASLESLMHWELAPENPVRLAKAGVTLAITSDGHENKADFWKHIREAVKRGLSADDALNALTLAPAELLGVADSVGSLAKGKIANLTISNAPLFDDKSKISETWVAGKRFEFEKKTDAEFTGVYEIRGAGASLYIVIKTDPKFSAEIRKSPPSSKSDDSKDNSEAASDDDSDLKPDQNESSSESESKTDDMKANDKSDTGKQGKRPADDPDATGLDSPRFENHQLNGVFDTKKPLQGAGMAFLSLQFTDEENAIGSLVLPDGLKKSITVKRIPDAMIGEKPKAQVDQTTETAEVKTEGLAAGGSAKDSKENSVDEEADKIAVPTAVNYPFGDFGRVNVPTPVSSCLIKNATIWTCSPSGTIENGSIYFENGVIKQIFKAGEETPIAKLVIDGSGLHVTPGLIDCHSHMATDSGVNEVGQAITAEVRIGDFIDCDDMTIYRQLAGGLTTSNILHGSANPIGGQNQVIKLRWGRNDQQMKFVEAPQGIKFALGENVKQSNRRDPSDRYPQTRMGVEQLMHDTFRSAQEYRQQQQIWREKREGLPPRIDLELEAIAEILEGTRWIHCHSYRQDEVLALIRVLDQYGITIGSFQHILEGYKVADAIAKHGGTASSFSDWWAYKMEVIDAIPQAGAVMHDAGIVVSFNSDDGELARHMNHEAAKAVKYGGVSEEEALKFVTLNPAKQLRIDTYVGSLEPGKHADMAIWNGNPLSLTSRCEQTWIDGCRYYDRKEAAALAKEQAALRTQLIQKALKAGGGKSTEGRGREDESLLWPRYDEYCHGHDHDHDH